MRAFAPEQEATFEAGARVNDTCDVPYNGFDDFQQKKEKNLRPHMKNIHISSMGRKPIVISQ